MKGIMRMLVAVGLVCLLATSVFASSVTAMESHSTVSSDGSCQVSINATVHLDSAVDKLIFPIPGNATGITLNGSRVTAPKKDGVKNLNIKKLTGGMAGDFSLHIAYNLSEVVRYNEEGILQMQIPLLSGFAYGVEEIRFSVTLPGTTDVLPSFVSGYHQSSIEQSLAFQTDGATVSGHSLKPMKDHETLTLIMAVMSAFLWEGYHSIFFVIGITVNTLAMGYLNAQNLRKSILLTSSLILIYNLFIPSIGGSINEVVAIFSSAIGIYRHRAKKHS